MPYITTLNWMPKKPGDLPRPRYTQKKYGEFFLLAHLFADLANFVMTLPQNPVEKEL
ncbi:MAG: hypothetical protein U5L09_02505 [Bacteroidales bacterium]|nr:hypothetical protein [Bacteroidales bacterium]